jgi:RES domain-containing protein
MEVYRITKNKYKADLSGYGAYLSGGRWNSKQKSVLYTAESRSLAMLETIVHFTSQSPNQQDFLIMVIYVPDDLIYQNYQTNQLSKHWKENRDETQILGNKWLDKSKEVLLKVPSAIVKNEHNILINSTHEDFQRIKLIDLEPFEFDMRLFGN